MELDEICQKIADIHNTICRIAKKKRTVNSVLSFLVRINLTDTYKNNINQSLEKKEERVCLQISIRLL